MRNRDYIIGCNYWDSAHGTDMWACYDESVIEQDLKELAETDIAWLRIFPNWRDFQPVQILRGWQGSFREYRMTGDRPLSNREGLDEAMLTHFAHFCDTAKRNGIHLIVSLVTGWMSGRLFVPPALEGKNPISDPEALMWQTRFVGGMVRRFKDHKAIVAWDLGNECNCLGRARSRAEAYHWTASIRNAIRAEDPVRPIYSGMHSLEQTDEGIWCMADQGELTDLLTTHPYPSFEVGGDIEPLNEPRTTVISSAQTEYYAGISGKPAMIEEQGTFSDILGHREIAADFVRVNLFSGWANGSSGYLFWCAEEHLHLKQPPYNWSMVERELGIFDGNRQPKPVARELQRVRQTLCSLPFAELPEKTVEAVCITTRDQAHWPVAASTYMLAKEAGFDLTFRHYDQPIPQAPIYLIPSICGWAVLNNEVLQDLLSRVAQGATLYFSTDTGLMTTFETLTGLRSHGIINHTGQRNCKFQLGQTPFTLSFQVKKQLLLENVSAEVLAEDEAGNVVFSRHSYGKGQIYFLAVPVEIFLWDTVGAFMEPEKAPYYQIYKTLAATALKKRLVRTGNPKIGLTEHLWADGSAVAVAINYTSRAQPLSLTCKAGYQLEPVYGVADEIPPCEAGIYLVKKG